MDKRSCKRTRTACYFVYVAMSSVFSLPPLLFATFKESYGISYTLLGSLVLINFCTQLGIDLIFTFFTKRFNIHKTLRFMPILTSLGLLVYALVPTFLPEYAYVGLVIGTILFSVAAGLAEVLVSPTVAALPSDTPDKDMSMLHSLYGYGLVGVIIISTLFLQFIGNEYWMLLTLFWAVLPLISSFLLFKCKLPQMNIEQGKVERSKTKTRSKTMLLCVICIFLGAAAENTMTNWISVYAENALNIPKIWGDIFGMCLFAALLALTRSGYAKFGKNIFKTLTISMAGAVVCYLVIGLSGSGIVSLIGCILVGVFTAMLWPGTLILMEEKVPAVGVAAYALMAAGGDLGASVSPQLLGVVVDKVSVTQWANVFAEKLSSTPEDIGFKVGMLFAAVFPIFGLILLAYMKKFFKNQKNI